MLLAPQLPIKEGREADQAPEKGARERESERDCDNESEKREIERERE